VEEESADRSGIGVFASFGSLTVKSMSGFDGFNTPEKTTGIFYPDHRNANRNARSNLVKAVT
jgi:hypothetical protein